MNLKKLTFVIVTHVYASGPSFSLEEYLSPQVKSLLFIGHPFSYTKDTRSFVRFYRNGKLIREAHFMRWKGPELAFYIKDVLLTLWWIFRYIGRADYFIGVNCLNATTGLMLRSIRKVKYVIFYTIDYVPVRTPNSLLNFLYHRLDRFSVEKSFKVWNLSQRMVEGREKNGISSVYRNKQIVVPVGTLPTSQIVSLQKIDRYKIVFMGHLREGQGVELLISAMHEVIKKVPSAHVLIIGGGPLEEKLRQEVKKMKLEKQIYFTGFVKDFLEVQNLLKDAAIAVAPYVDNERTFTRYTDPGKPKDYLASGIPVIITKVPEVALEIDKRKCGIAISYSKLELANAIIKLLSNDKLLTQYKKNAIQMAKDYTWEKIYTRALHDTLSN